MNVISILEQAIDRAVVRIREGRTRAVDLLALNSLLPDCNKEFLFAGTLQEILASFQNHQQELDRLLEDLGHVNCWEKSAYWRNAKTVLEGFERYRQDGSDLKALLEGKSREQLESMRNRVLQSKEKDAEYWSLADFLIAYRLAHLYLEPFFGETDGHVRSHALRLVGVGEYTDWRDRNLAKINSSQIKPGYDNSFEALEFQERVNSRSLRHMQQRIGHFSVSEKGDMIPRYFATVYKTTPWTKHNRLFYDKKNPPEAVPIGYCFEVFFKARRDNGLADIGLTKDNRLELPGKMAKPSYQIERLSDNWILLWFYVQDPLYKRLSFTINNLEWDYNSSKGSGFCCKYEGDVLLLRFWFKERRLMRPAF